MIDTIGNTRLRPLTHVVPKGSARILLKCEYENPTGSMKDRMALAMVEAAEADGRLAPDGSVVEYTGGSTGVSLAFVCAAKRRRVQIVTSTAASIEKRSHMVALGAEMTLIKAPNDLTTKEVILEMIETARKLAEAPGSYWTNQFQNRDQPSAYTRLANEVWAQSEQKIDAFAQIIGTCGSLRGTSKRLRELNPNVRIVGIEPSESPVIAGGAPGAHNIEGTGPGFVPPLWEDGLADEMRSVSTADAQAMARRLAKEEGIFAGTSTGANVLIALQLAAELGEGKTVLAIACDSGMKYLSTTYKE